MAHLRNEADGETCGFQKNATNAGLLCSPNQSVACSFHPATFLKMSTQEKPVGGAIGILSLPCPPWVL